MLRRTSRALVSAAGRATGAPSTGSLSNNSSAACASQWVQNRTIGKVGVPENYGQIDGVGTSFLGTPVNHRELLAKRPISPDVFDVDGTSHYKFPAVALSSITNRVTGVFLSGAVGFGGAVSALGGPEALPVFVELFKSTVPILVFPTKLVLSFPFVYHTLGGFRHIYWDKTTNGIDNQSAKQSSLALFAASGVGAAALAGYSF